MKPAAWSFSRLEKFVNCPLAFYEVAIAKTVPDSQGEAAIWGNTVHEHIEKYINIGTPMPAVIDAYKGQIYRALMAIGGIANSDTQINQVFVKAEYEAALSNKFQAVTWSSKMAWMRVILDVIRVEGSEAWVIDWKTGKVKPNSRQLKLFALAVFHTFPGVRTVHTSFEWLQHNEQTQETYCLTDVVSMWDLFVHDLTQYKDAFLTDTWQPRPSGLCKNHCNVFHCQHNGRKGP